VVSETFSTSLANYSSGNTFFLMELTMKPLKTLSAAAVLSFSLLP
jgi:hypothetical protein